MRNWPLTLSLRPAVLPVMANATMHCIVAFAFLASGPAAVRWLAVPLLVVSFHAGWRNERAKQGRVMILHGDGSLMLSGSGEAERFIPSNCVSGVDFGRVLWLSWRPTGCWRRQAMLLVPSNLESARAWRLLRIWLRYMAARHARDKRSAEDA